MKAAVNRLTPDEILEAMRLGVAYRTAIQVRGFNLMVRPLSQTETLQLYCDVATEMQRLPEGARNSMMEHALIAKKTLIQASTSEPNKMDFQITDQVLERMTFDELSFLFKQYALVVEKVNPAWDQMPEDEVFQLIEHVKKNPSTLIDLSSLQMINVCRQLLTGSHTASFAGGLSMQ